MRFRIHDLRVRPVSDTLVLTAFAGDKLEQHPLWLRLAAAERRQAQRMHRSLVEGEGGAARVFWRAGGGRVMLLGLGKRSAWSRPKLVLAVRRLVALAQADQVTSLTLAPEPMDAWGLGAERLAQLTAENMLMAAYRFTQYKSSAEAKRSAALKTVGLVFAQAGLSAARAGLKVGQAVGEAVNLARDLGNISGGEMTPHLLAERARVVGRALGLRVQVFGRRELARLGAGAILGVAHGSSEEPRLIVMEYRGAGAAAPLVFVGKGVTFDSGGLNLKPTGSINDMHLDMLGGAAVVAALAAVAKLKLPVNLVGIVPAVENMPGSASYRPGDVLRSLSGKTIEVLNTDAEGRVILADALTYAARFKPSLVVDVATLTGACAVGLGLKLSGLLTPDRALQQELMEVGETSGDYVWPLPLWEEYEDEVKGTFGDLQNVGKSKYGDAIMGAMFLRQFTQGYPWAHLDIAGPMKTVEGQHLAPGASGVGVRFLIELARRRAGR